VAALGIAALALTGCSDSDVALDDDASSEDAIIGGVSDATDRAVVELIETVGRDDYTCTASFISRTVLITAAHCVVDERHPKRLPPAATYRVMTAASNAHASASTTFPIPQANVHPHPGYDGKAAHDVAIVVLDRPFDVRPLPVRMRPLPTSAVGSSVRIVGYGQRTRQGLAGTRRMATTVLRKIEGDLLLVGRTGQQACEGDSGGPALLRIDGVETIVGLDDLSPSSSAPDCTGGDLYQRVDRHADFIAPYL
jgi:V8-like Glu-specific endopeptidase